MTSSTAAAPPDGGYGWVVVAASFLLYVCAAAPFMSLGVFIVEWSGYYDTTKVALGWIGALLGCGSLAGVILGPLSRRYGCRSVGLVGSLFNLFGFSLCFFAPNVPFLFFSYGFLTGMGNACLTITATVGVQLYFVKRRALASSMAVTGTAAGVFFWPPFSRFLMDVFAWKGACLIIGAILFNSAIFCALIQPLRKSPKKVPLEKLESPTDDTESAKPLQNGSNQTSKTQSNTQGSLKGKMNILSSFTYKVYILDIVYCTGFWFIYGGHLVLLTFTPIRASYLGFTKHQGAWLVSICGIASGTLRTFVGCLGDQKWVNRTILQGCGGILAASLTLFSLFFKSYILLAVYEGFYGASTAIFVALHGSVIVDVFTIERVDLGVGMTMVSSGLAGFLVLPLAGRLLDMTENPSVPYSLFSVWQMIGGLLVAVVVPILKRYTKRDLTVKETAGSEPEVLSNMTDLTPMETQPLRGDLENENRTSVQKVDESVA